MTKAWQPAPACG